MRIERVGPHVLVLADNSVFKYLGSVSPVAMTIFEGAGVKADLSNLSVVMDPPYGIDIMVDYADVQRSKAAASKGRNFKPVHGNDEDFDPMPWLFGCDQLMWGSNHYGHRLPWNGRALVWDKRCNIMPSRCQADCEIAWCSDYGAARVFYHYWDGMLKQSERGEARIHPTQKPVELMRWCLQFSKGSVVFDPYMGGGSTGIACVKEGRTFIGVEIEPEYFEASLARIKLAYSQPDLFNQGVA